MADGIAGLPWIDKWGIRIGPWTGPSVDIPGVNVGPYMGPGSPYRNVEALPASPINPVSREAGKMVVPYSVGIGAQRMATPLPAVPVAPVERGGIADLVMPETSEQKDEKAAVQQQAQEKQDGFSRYQAAVGAGMSAPNFMGSRKSGVQEVGDFLSGIPPYLRENVPPKFEQAGQQLDALGIPEYLKENVGPKFSQAGQQLTDLGIPDYLKENVAPKFEQAGQQLTDLGIPLPTLPQGLPNFSTPTTGPMPQGSPDFRFNMDRSFPGKEKDDRVARPPQVAGIPGAAAASEMPPATGVTPDGQTYYQPPELDQGLNPNESTIEDFVRAANQMYAGINMFPANPAEEAAMAYARDAERRNNLLAQLAWVGQVAKSSGKSWEGYGQGFIDAAEVHDKGFKRYQDALNDAADRTGRRQAREVDFELAKRDAASKLFAEDRKEKRSQRDANIKAARDSITKLYDAEKDLLFPKKSGGGLDALMAGELDENGMPKNTSGYDPKMVEEYLRRRARGERDMRYYYRTNSNVSDSANRVK